MKNSIILVAIMVTTACSKGPSVETAPVADVQEVVDIAADVTPIEVVAASDSVTAADDVSPSAK